MSDTHIILGKVGGADSETAFPCVKVIDNEDGTFSLAVSGSELTQIQTNQTTIIANQTTIITKLTAIENLLSGGIGVNILSGGGL